MSVVTIPFSLRLTAEEHRTLKEAAGLQSMAQFARGRLFDEEVKLRKKRGLRPIKDREALGRVLGMLGVSNVSQNLDVIAEAARSGCLNIDTRTLQEVTEACTEIKAMRRELMQALGLRIKETEANLAPIFMEAAE